MSLAIRRSKLEVLFDNTNKIVMILLCFITLYPFIYLLKVSLSEVTSMNVQTLSLIPETIDFTAYGRVLKSEYIITGFENTLLRVILGVSLSVMASIFTAYPLAKKRFPHRIFWTTFVVFTMFFQGGLIPSYLLIKNLHLMDKVWSLILPGLIPTFSMIIMRNFFQALPDELEESAKIDGANDIVILLRIIIPMSAPIIATVAMWSAVAHWNAWFDSLIYISDSRKQVLQLILRRIVIEGTNQAVDFNSMGPDSQALSPEAIKAATIMVATAPILAAYPFVQKYFVKGIIVGSLKG